MDINLMVFAAPFYLILIATEYIVARYKKVSLYEFNDSINNFCSGILEEIGSLPFRGLLIYSYYYLYEHHAFFHFSASSVTSWILLWLCVDFCYYWYHRASHRNNFFWIGHSVHHQSELYNLSVALRQGFFQTMTSWVFYLPLALLGFSTSMFLIVVLLNTVYQFWLHTPFINKMGWLEKIFNTPSHHRVHHGRNPQYIDKNYAGSLIIWDKLFGTFEPEIAPAEYGVTEPLDSWNPFYANIKVIKDVIYYGNGLKSKWTLLRAFFMPPEWIIHRLAKENSLVTKRNSTRNNSDTPKIYILINLMFLLSLYTWLSFIFTFNSPISWLLGLLILVTLYVLGRIANGNNKIQFFEITRTFLVIGIINILFNNLLLAFGAGVLFYLSNYFLFIHNSLNNATYYVEN